MNTIYFKSEILTIQEFVNQFYEPKKCMLCGEEGSYNGNYLHCTNDDCPVTSFWREK